MDVVMALPICEQTESVVNQRAPLVASQAVSLIYEIALLMVKHG